ncbi:MAG: polyprenol monophosphomannose synthase [Chloroflexota bacterium]|jgi:dolichol-phosphate mannosyltransferase
MQKTVVVIPTLNEARNLPVLVAELWALQIPGLSVLVVDGGSTDGTGQIADELAERRPDQLAVLHLSSRGGLRRAYLAAFKWALAHEADRVVQMDSDFSHSPSYVPKLLEAGKDADLVVGSRYVAGAKLDARIGTARYLQSWWANEVYARLILNLRLQDATSSFRCWQAEALRRIDLDAISSNGYSFQIEMAYVAEKLGYNIVEVPIHYEERRVGRSKLNLAAKLEAAWRTWEILWRYRDYGEAPARSLPAGTSQNGHEPPGT